MYDNPDGKTNDDCVEIIVLQDFTTTQTVNSYERDVNDNEYIKIKHHRDDGLDGKVSRIEIYPPSRGIICYFYHFTLNYFRINVLKE